MQRVLVLDAFYQPSRVVSWERAICMLYDERAEVVENTSEVVSSPSVTMHVPSIIRMTRKTRSRKVSIKFSRANVLLRDGHTCQYCRREFEPHQINCDHVLPRSRGGRTEWENIVAACYPCNGRKGDRTPGEAKMPLLREPRKPHWLPVVPKKFDLKTVPDSWRGYFSRAA